MTASDRNSRKMLRACALLLLTALCCTTGGGAFYALNASYINQPSSLVRAVLWVTLVAIAFGYPAVLTLVWLGNKAEAQGIAFAELRASDAARRKLGRELYDQTALNILLLLVNQEILSETETTETQKTLVSKSINILRDLEKSVSTLIQFDKACTTLEERHVHNYEDSNCG